MPDGPRRDDMVSLTVGINLPIWGKTKRDPRVAEALAMRGQAQEMHQAQRNEVVMKLRQQVALAEQSARSARLYGTAVLPQARLTVEAARRLGARTIIAVDVIYPPQDARPRTAVGVLFQAFLITVHGLKAIETARADFVIAPELGRSSSQFTFGDRARLEAAGEKAALEVIDRLRPLFAAAR